MYWTPLARAPNVNVRRVCGARLDGGGSVGRESWRFTIQKTCRRARTYSVAAEMDR